MLKSGWLLLGVLILLLAACSGGSSDDPQVVEQGGVIQWPRNPLHVVFRAEVTGGDSDPFLQQNVVPLCSVYGDGRVVWTTPNNSGFDDVVFDFLNDQQIADFISYLTVVERIYTYENAFNLQPQSSVTPVYERLIVRVNDRDHVTDAFADWPDEYFDRILDRCRTLSLTPRRFAPDGGWISARFVPYNPNVPGVYWEAEPNGLSLAAIASEGERWVEGPVVPVLWEILRTNPPDMQFTEEDAQFEIALRVPGVTLDAPPAP